MKLSSAVQDSTRTCTSWSSTSECCSLTINKGKGKRFLHGNLICTYTLYKYIADIYVDRLCIISRNCTKKLSVQIKSPCRNISLPLNISEAGRQRYSSNQNRYRKSSYITTQNEQQLISRFLFIQSHKIQLKHLTTKQPYQITDVNIHISHGDICCKLGDII